MLVSMIAQAELAWLNSQMTPFKNNSALIKSYTHKNQSYLYDQALSIITFSRSHDYKKASKLAAALKNLQNEDGGWFFSYYLDGSSPHPLEGHMQPHGAIAWAALSLITYEKYSGDKSYRAQWKKALNLIENNLVKVDGFRGKGVRFSSVDNTKTPWNETDIVSLEHVVDSLAAFKAAYEVSHLKKYKIHQKELEVFALEFWDEGSEHFWPGVKISNSKINKNEFYLDNQSWTALALEHLKLLPQMKKALSSSCKLMVKENNHVGFKEARRSIASEDFIWSEGTAGKALALNLYGQTCKNTSSESYLKTLESFKVNGGVLYVNKDVPDFEAKPSVAGTTWTWFLRHKINPFRL
jgi:hypothetical protein